MTLFTEKGTFTKTTSTGVPVSQEINLSGAFQPKILILWSNAQTTSNGTFTDHNSSSFGFSDGTNDICHTIRANETNEQDAVVFRNDAIISILSLTANSELSRASLTSFDSDGFTLSWAVQSDTTAMVIHYLAIGGTDITNVSAFTSTSQNVATGNHSWNGSGTSFQPDFAITLCTSDFDNTPLNTVTGNVDASIQSIGAATGTSSNQWVLMARHETVTTSDEDMYLNNGSCLGTMDTGSGAITYLGTFVSFDNAAGGGITINITDAPTTAARLGFLLVKGGNWKANTFQQRSGTGTQNITLTDSTVTPRAVFLVGINSATANTVVANHYVCMGGSDGTNEGNCWNGNTNALGTWQTARSSDTGKVYRQGNAPAATGSSTTTAAESDMADMSTAGQFTLDWTTADTTQRRMAYFMVGEVAAAGNAVQKSIIESTISITEASITLARNKIRTGIGTITVNG